MQASHNHYVLALQVVERSKGFARVGHIPETMSNNSGRTSANLSAFTAQPTANLPSLTCETDNQATRIVTLAH